MPILKHIMSNNRWIFWHRRDLRLNDNKGLYKTREITSYITGIYILDEEIIDPKNKNCIFSPAKKWFLSESLKELEEKWKMAGSRLLILTGKPIDILPEIVNKINAKGICWNENYEPYEQERDRAIKRKLITQSINIKTFTDQLIVDPYTIKNAANTPYRVYTPFFNNWRNRISEDSYLDHEKDIIKTYKNPASLKDISEMELESLINFQAKLIQSKSANSLTNQIKRHEFSGSGLCPCRPGEDAAKKQLNSFLDNGVIYKYNLGRDIPSEDGTSSLSAAINFGTISCREIWNSTQLARDFSRSIEDNISIKIWERELAWREFYQNSLINFPEIANGPLQKKWENFPWSNNKEWYKSWMEGLTGFPIVDAAMRQLNQSGWMHNRCRMIVASFLVKDFICNWQWGEQYFMSKLVDGDLAANNGGWQWSSSSGVDTKPIRIFNPTRQASKFDADAYYIRKWLPELAHISTSDLILGTIPSLERRGYPEPLIDHRIQQRQFKQIYANI